LLPADNWDAFGAVRRRDLAVLDLVAARIRWSLFNVPSPNSFIRI
jgi:hypothetical protein